MAVGRGEAVIVAEDSGLVEFEGEGEMVVVRIADGWSIIEGVVIEERTGVEEWFLQPVNKEIKMI